MKQFLHVFEMVTGQKQNGNKRKKGKGYGRKKNGSDDR